MTTAPGTAPLPELVVRWLGRVAVAGIVVGGILVVLAIEAKAQVDAAVIGVISTFLAIVTGATGALGAILASTRSADPGTVTVTPPTANNPATAVTAPSSVTVTTTPEASSTVATDGGESLAWFVLVVAAVCAGILLAHVILKAT